MSLHSFSSIRYLLLVAMIFVVSGCGDVAWFPEYERQPTTPDLFSFPTKTGVAPSAPVTSDAITVAGLTAATSPISITGPSGSNSQYSINGATATSAEGTVKNGDRVTVTHTSSNALATSVTSTLTIGNVTGTFTSTTRSIATPSFSQPITVGQFRQVFADLTAVDGAPGTHVISIKDTANSGNAQFSIGDADRNPTTFTSTTQTIPVLNDRRIFVRNTPSTTSVSTTLTIDGVDFSVNLSQ